VNQENSPSAINSTVVQLDAPCPVFCHVEGWLLLALWKGLIEAVATDLERGFRLRTASLVAINLCLGRLTLWLFYLSLTYVSKKEIEELFDR
jgi:hypothetical protein